MAIYQLGDTAPVIADSAWVADSATVLGHVELAEEASIWYGAVLRADNDRIVVGRGSNIQDGSVLHTDTDIELVIGDNVTVGHQVMLHGCTIGDGTLIGIQSIVLNGARIGRHCLVAAGALITQDKEFPDGSLIMGSPARVVRPLDAQEIERGLWSARHYIEQARRHRELITRLR